jgi:hypothetical protein
MIGARLGGGWRVDPHQLYKHSHVDPNLTLILTKIDSRILSAWPDISMRFDPRGPYITVTQLTAATGIKIVGAQDQHGSRAWTIPLVRSINGNLDGILLRLLMKQ